MQIIEVKTLQDGAHNNQTFHGILPEGYAYIPDDMELPFTYPFVNITVEGDTVTSMEANQEAYEAFRAEALKRREARKAKNLTKKYEARVVELIRQKYTDSEEFKILREYLADKNETTEKAFTDYNNYVIECKATAKKEILGE